MFVSCYWFLPCPLTFIVCVCVRVERQSVGVSALLSSCGIGMEISSLDLASSALTSWAIPLDFFKNISTWANIKSVTLVIYYQGCSKLYKLALLRKDILSMSQVENEGIQKLITCLDGLSYLHLTLLTKLGWMLPLDNTGLSLFQICMLF